MGEVVYDFFIAYSRPDRALATRLALALGDRVFIDHLTIAPGAEWPAAIRAAMDASNVIVVLVGERPGRYFTEEVARAIDRSVEGAGVVPVLVHDGVKKPYGLEIIQHLDLERGRALETVVSQLRTIAVVRPSPSIQQQGNAQANMGGGAASSSPPALGAGDSGQSSLVPIAIDADDLLHSLVVHNRVSANGAEVVAHVKDRWPSSFDQPWHDRRDSDLNRTILDGLIPRYAATVVVLEANFIKAQRRTSLLSNVRERAMAYGSGPVFVLGDGVDRDTRQIVGECPLVHWYREPSREVRRRELLAMVDQVLENRRR